MQFSTSRFSSLMQFNLHAVAPVEDNTMQHVFRAFGLTRSVINNIQQLIRLLADVQRHRACSLAILSGNGSFENQARGLDRKINARLAYLNLQAEMVEVVDPYQWDSVFAQWKVVSGSWRPGHAPDDNLMHNFELQSHLVKTIINIVRDAGRWVMRSGSYSEKIADHYLASAVFSFIFTSHLYQIETLGRLRGLGTHVANNGCSDDGMRSRITFLLQCVREEQVISRNFHNSQSASVIANTPAIIDIELADDSFQEWLELVAAVVQETIQPSDALAHQAFTLGSHIIDARLLLTEQVLGYLQLAIEEMLETVLEETVQ